MRTTAKCPKCGCRKILVIDKVAQPDDDSLNIIHAMCVTCVACSSEDLGLPERNECRAAVGSFEAWVCTACGYTEWYAKDFQRALWNYLQRNPHDVRLVDGDVGSAGPYR
jgi:predicted nucleic-acid-binding Zn-ribbon protein